MLFPGKLHQCLINQLNFILFSLYFDQGWRSCPGASCVVINFEPIFEQNANFGPIFEKSAYYSPIFEKSVNSEHFVNGEWTHY